MGLFSSGLSRNVRWDFETKARVLTYPAMGDVNGDGIPEVVFGSDDHSVYALRGSDGSVAWRFQTDGPVRSSPTVADVNGDGVPEVVFGSDDSTVYALNGVDGTVIWALRCDGPIRSVPAVGDIDCDGRTEVVVCGDDAGVYAIDGKSGELIWQSSHRGARSGAIVQSAPVLADLNGDGRLEIITGSASNYILVFGSDGSLLVRREFEAPSFNVPLAAGDLNGDGETEIVIASDNGALYVANSEGETIWSKVVGMGTRSPPVIGDLNGDGEMEVLVHVTPDAGDDGKLLCIAFNGDTMWERTLKGHGGSTPVAVDVDHDGGLEIVAFSRDDGAQILNAEGDEKKTLGTRAEAMIGPAVGDADASGELDLVYTCRGKIVCLSTGYPVRHGQIMNPGALGDERNTGCYRTLIQRIEDMKGLARRMQESGAEVGVPWQRLLRAEQEQGKRDILKDLREVERSLAVERSKLAEREEMADVLMELKSRLKTFSSLDIDGASQLALSVSRIESRLSEGEDVSEELEAAEEMADELEDRSDEKIQALNSKRLAFLVGQFLEKFPEPTDQDVEGFIQYLESEDLPFLPYEIKKAIESRKHERKFQSLRESGRFDFMSEEEKVIAIGSSLAESIIHDIQNSIGVSPDRIQLKMDELASDYPDVPRLVVSDEGKILTDEMRKRLRDLPPEKVISGAVSLFSLYITKLFDFYQELTDFETSYSRFKTSMEYLIETFGAEELVSQFQEKACHGIFAEEVRVKRILDL